MTTGRVDWSAPSQVIDTRPHRGRDPRADRARRSRWRPQKLRSQTRWGAHPKPPQVDADDFVATGLAVGRGLGRASGRRSQVTQLQVGRRSSVAAPCPAEKRKPGGATLSRWSQALRWHRGDHPPDRPRTISADSTRWDWPPMRSSSGSTGPGSFHRESDSRPGPPKLCATVMHRRWEGQSWARKRLT